MKTIVIYHRSDFDGIFCREIARKFLPEAELIGLEYGDPLPSVSDEDRLYILDFSVPELMNHPHLIWIDHHKTAMEKFGQKEGFQIDGVAACRLAWQYFTIEAKQMACDDASQWPKRPTKQDFIDRLVSEPLAVRLAGEYDIWDKRDPNADLFQHGLRSRDLDANTWDRLLTPEGVHPDGVVDAGTILVRELLASGKAVAYAKTQENESISKNQSFTLVWEGKTLIACNAARFNSHLFTAALLPEHDGCLGFCWDGKMKKWKVSLYGVPGKPDVDLSPIALKYGGGGHKQACGFTCTTLPFPLL